MSTPALAHHGGGHGEPEGIFPSYMGDVAASTGSAVRPPSLAPVSSGWKARLGLGGIARRTLGIAFLLTTVFTWTLSNFLNSVRQPQKKTSRDGSKSVAFGMQLT